MLTSCSQLCETVEHCNNNMFCRRATMRGGVVINYMILDLYHHSLFHPCSPFQSCSFFLGDVSTGEYHLRAKWSRATSSIMRYMIMISDSVRKHERVNSAEGLFITPAPKVQNSFIYRYCELRRINLRGIESNGRAHLYAAPLLQSADNCVKAEIGSHFHAIAQRRL